MHVCLLLAVLVGCGFTAPNDPTELPGVDASTPVTPGVDAPLTSTTLTVRTFITELVTLECLQGFACRSQYPETPTKTFEAEWGTDLPSCLAIDTDVQQIGLLEASVAAGRMTFDPSLAPSCLAAPGLPSSCSVLFSNNWDLADSCYLALSGNVPDDAACSTGWECGLHSACRGGFCRRQ